MACDNKKEKTVSIVICWEFDSLWFFSLYFFTIVVYRFFYCYYYLFVAVSYLIKCQKNCMIIKRRPQVHLCFESSWMCVPAPSNHQDLLVSWGISGWSSSLFLDRTVLFSVDLTYCFIDFSLVIFLLHMKYVSSIINTFSQWLNIFV